ncbi:hypothetical protein [Limosilactobacillus reuteri]|uniref:hypothetical protein n=1 Tax=Limosilactobacillus reuteri TaxID=1598 RepID=UPI00129B9E90|nr:hypothetical protein [Limosilactobacillus reuteri]MRG63274.1 hypothetical protein [Limosilactobacillus reuteri]
MKSYHSTVRRINDNQMLYEVFDANDLLVDHASRDQGEHGRLRLEKFSVTVSDITSFLSVSRNYVMTKIKPYVEHVKCKVNGESLYFSQTSLYTWLNSNFTAYRRTEALMVKDIEGGQEVLEKAVMQGIKAADEALNKDAHLEPYMVSSDFKRELIATLLTVVENKKITWIDKKRKQHEHSSLITSTKDSFVDHQRLCPLVPASYKFSDFFNSYTPEKVTYVTDRRKVYNNGHYVEFKDNNADVRPLTRYVEYKNDELEVLQVVKDILKNENREELLTDDLVFTKVSFYS